MPELQPDSKAGDPTALVRMRRIAVLVDDRVAFRRQRVDLALLFGGRRRPFCLGPIETLGGFP